MKKLQTLEEFNKKRREYHAKQRGNPVKNGIVCPKCDKEMYDLPAVIHTDPPQRQIWCKHCKYTTYRVD
jgi:hypothetical protein